MENRENPDVNRLLSRKEELERMITDTLTELHRLEELGDSEEVAITNQTLETLQAEKVDVAEQLRELGIE